MSHIMSDDDRVKIMMKDGSFQSLLKTAMWKILIQGVFKMAYNMGYEAGANGRENLAHRVDLMKEDVSNV